MENIYEPIDLAKFEAEIDIVKEVGIERLAIPLEQSILSYLNEEIYLR